MATPPHAVIDSIIRTWVTSYPPYLAHPRRIYRCHSRAGVRASQCVGCVARQTHCLSFHQLIQQQLVGCANLSNLHTKEITDTNKKVGKLKFAHPTCCFVTLPGIRHQH